jgi:hypothetical protein
MASERDKTASRSRTGGLGGLPHRRSVMAGAYRLSAPAFSAAVARWKTENERPHHLSQIRRDL